MRIAQILLLVSLVVSESATGGGGHRYQAAQTQNGTVWVRKIAGFAVSLSLNPQNFRTAYAGLTDFSGFNPAMFVSRDAGEHWDSLWTNPGDWIIAIVANPADSMKILAGEGAKGLWRSTNGGTTWGKALDSVGCAGESIVIDRASPNRIYLGSDMYAKITHGGFYSSTDYGATWRPSPGAVGRNYCSVALRQDSSNIIYGGMNGGFLNKSTDYGMTWRQVDSSGSDETPIVVIDPKNPLIAYAVHYYYGPGNSNKGGVSKTTNGGESWFLSGLNGVKMWSLDVDPDNTSILLAGELDSLGRMFESTDAGQTWSDFSNGLTPMLESGSWATKVASVSAALALTALWGTPDGGVYKLENVTGALRQDDGVIPQRMALEQNFPNPFNPSTTIRYDLSDRGHVTVSVFNVLGQEVAKLVNEVQEPGHHEVRFDGSGYASGVYYYRLNAGEYLATKKLLLLR